MCVCVFVRVYSNMFSAFYILKFSHCVCVCACVFKYVEYVLHFEVFPLCVYVSLCLCIRLC